MLLIIDNQSQYLRSFKRNYLDDRDVPHLIVEHNEVIDWEHLPPITGLMLSGGKGNPYEPLNLTANFTAMMNLEVPTIGFCLGHEIIAVAHRAKIKRLPEYQSRKAWLTLDKPDDPIFAGLDKTRISIQKKHHFHVPTVPPGCELLAHSEVCPVEAFRHYEKPIYGFQGHPEVSGAVGMQIMENFLQMCGLQTG